MEEQYSGEPVWLGWPGMHHLPRSFLVFPPTVSHFQTYDIITEENEGASSHYLSSAHPKFGCQIGVLLLSRHLGAEWLRAGQTASSGRSNRCMDNISGMALSLFSKYWRWSCLVLALKQTGRYRHLGAMAVQYTLLAAYSEPWQRACGKLKKTEDFRQKTKPPGWKAGPTTKPCPTSTLTAELRLAVLIT